MNIARARPARPTGPRQAGVTAAVLVCAASMLGLGAWAFLAPESFARFIDFPPTTSTSSTTPAPSRSASG